MTEWCSCNKLKEAEEKAAKWDALVQTTHSCPCGARRTCHIELDWDAMEDQISGYRIWRCSCGESFLFFRGRKPSFCPECGAKVVE